MNEDEERQEQDADRTPGWIKLYRQILESSFWLEDEPYDLRSAFIYVLVSANWKPQVFHPRNGPMITVQRGQMFTSIRSLAEQFHRSTKWVRNWFRRMIDHGTLEVEVTTLGTLLTVVNYSKYQDVGHIEETLSDTQRKHRVTRRGNTEGTRYKKDKNERSSRREKYIFSPPSADDVLAYAMSENIPMTQQDAEQFVLYNQARGWKGVADWHPLVKYRGSQIDGGADPDQEDPEERRET